MRWYNRLQIQALLELKLTPGKDPARDWLFSTTGHCTLFNELLKSRSKLPDVRWDRESPQVYWDRRDNVRSNCLWLAFCLTILGITIGAGLFYQRKNNVRSSS